MSIAKHCVEKLRAISDMLSPDELGGISAINAL